MEHGLFKHGYQLHDEQINVPLLFYWEGHLESEVREDLVSGIDVAPTLLGLAGIAVPPGMLGRDLFESEPEGAVAFSTHFSNQDQRGIRSKRWKVIENLGMETLEVYDLRADPGEQKNLYQGDREQFKEAFAAFERLMEKHDMPSPWADTDPAPEISDEERADLEALGYL